MKVRIIAITFLWSACMVGYADDWEISLIKANRIIPSRDMRSEMTLSPFGFRTGWRVEDLDDFSFRIEGDWLSSASAEIQEIDPTSGHSFAYGRANLRSLSLGLRGETWFLDRFVCASAVLEERLNQVDAYRSTLDGTSKVSSGNKLPQTWARVGLGIRTWFFGAADSDRSRRQSWYPILRMELGMAISAPGRGLCAELLPRQELSMSWGVRF